MSTSNDEMTPERRAEVERELGVSVDTPIGERVILWGIAALVALAFVAWFILPVVMKVLSESG